MRWAARIESYEAGRLTSGSLKNSSTVKARRPLRRAAAIEKGLWSTPTEPSARVARFRPTPQPTSIVRPRRRRRMFARYGACTLSAFFHHLDCSASSRSAYALPSVLVSGGSSSSGGVIPISLLTTRGTHQGAPAIGHGSSGRYQVRDHRGGCRVLA